MICRYPYPRTMRTFVPVYLGGRCIELFKTLFAKYWPGQELVVVPNDTEKWWSNSLIDFFNSIEDKYFALFLEDHILVRPVELSVIADCEEMMNHVDKIELTGAFFTREDLIRSEKTENSEFFDVSQTDAYRATLHPCIWKREYFLKLLRPWMTAWDFELKNDKRSVNDGRRVLAVRPYPCGMANFLDKGKVNKNCLNEFRDEDRELARAAYFLFLGLFPGIYQILEPFNEVAFGVW